VDKNKNQLKVVDERGTYWPPHAVFPLILQHLVENRKMKGTVVQAVSLGYLSERMAKEYKLPFVEVPVGFKYVADQMAKTKVLWGGEESGGYGVGLWGPERDGLLSGLLLVEALLAFKKPLSVLGQEMQKRFGASSFSRVDLSLKAPVVDKAAWIQSITKKIPAKLAGQPVKETRDKDGLKVVLADESWVLLRPSGTEPLMRLYAEATSPETAALLLSKAQDWSGAKSL
jgi:phosphomannomutase